LDVGFTDHFTTQLEITLNYSAIADLLTSQITVTHAKSFLAHNVFTSSCLATASNNGYSSASGLSSSSNGGSLPTELFFKVKVKVTSRLAVYRQSARLGTRPLEAHDQILFPTELLR
jgi:hypothetical protein